MFTPSVPALGVNIWYVLTNKTRFDASGGMSFTFSGRVT